MKSRRSWLVGLALGAALFFGTPSAKAQVPRGITYQGLLEQNGQPFNGSVQLDFTFADSAGTTQIFSSTIPGVQVTNGIFNVVLPGGPTGAKFPASMNFNQQYSMTITVTPPNGTPVTLPAQLFWAAPYALNADRVNGLSASPTPVNGELFPVPLNSAGRIDTSILPAIPNSLLQSSYIQTINSQGPDANGDFQINAGSGIAVATGPHSVTISTTGGAGQLQGVFGVNGITGGGTTGTVFLGIGAGAITANMIAPGAISGQKITGIAGNALSQDAFGFLNVNVDNSTIGITSNQNGNYLEVLPGGIGTLQLANGSVTNAKIANPYITFTSAGNTLLSSTPQPTQLGGTQNYDINLGHSNDWTVVQAFHNINDTGTVANVGALNETGATTMVGTVNQSGGSVNLLSAGTAGNTFTVGASGSSNASTFYGPLTQSSGNVSLATTAGNTVTIGNATGSTNITGALTQQTGNVSFTPGTTNTFTVANPTGTNTITGTTNINATGGGTTNIGGSGTGSTNNIMGPTNINTSGSALTTIGSTVAGSTTTIQGNVNSGVTANSIVNNFGTANNAASPTNTFGSYFNTNAAGNISSSSNTFYGTSYFDINQAGNQNGPIIRINGQATPNPGPNDYELYVTGDANITGTLNVGTFMATNGDFVNIKFDNAAPHTPNGVMTINSAPGGLVNTGSFSLKSGGFMGTQVEASLTANRTYTWPDKSGTVAMLSDIANIDPPTALNQTIYSISDGMGGFKWTHANNLQNDGTTVTVTGPFNAQGTNTLSGTTTISGNLTVSNAATSITSTNTTFTIPNAAPAVQFNPQFAGSDVNLVTLNGLNTLGAVAPAVVGINNNQYEFTDLGDARITGTLDAGAVWTGLMAAQNIKFDNASAYTSGGTMSFNSTGTTNPTVTVNGASTQYNLFVNSPAGALGGIKVTGAGAGVGLYVDPFPTGVNIQATNTGLIVGGGTSTPTTGATLNASTTGLAIGSIVMPTTGQTIAAGTTGLSITNAPTSINATGSINSTGTTGTGSTLTSALNAGTYTLTVNNTAGSANTTDALSVGGAMTSTGNATLATNSGTTNTFGNNAAASNAIGNGATINRFGETATTNTYGTNAGTNQFGAALGSNVTNTFGLAQAGSTSTNTFGNPNGGTANNTIGGTSGTATNTVLGVTNVNATTAFATNVGTGTGTNALGNTTASTTILGNPLNMNAGVGLVTNIGTGAGTGGTINIGNTTSTTNIIGNLNANNGQTIFTSNSSPIVTIQTAGGVVGTGLQLQPNGGTLTTGANIQANGTGLVVGGVTSPTTGATINASTTGMSLTTAPTSISATGAINTTGTTNTTGSTFSLNNGGLTTLQVTNANNSTTAPALGVSGAFTSTGNSTIGTNAATTNSLGNVGASTNNIGNGSGAANNIGNGGGTTVNIIGSSANSNQIGTNATTNWVGLNAATNNFGLSTGGGTVNNTYGSAAGGSTATNQIGSLTGTTSNSMLATGTNTITGTTNINTSGSANTTVGNAANTPGQVAAFNGTVTMTGTGQATNELSISGVTAAQWGEHITYPNGANGGLLVDGTNGNALQVNAGVTNGLQVTSPTTNGVNLASMAGATGVNYAGTTGTGVNAVLSGAGFGVIARVNGAGAYTGPAGSAAIVGLQNLGVGLPSAGIVGLNGVTTTSVDGAGAGVVGETNFSNDAGVVGTNSTSGLYGIGVLGWSQTATNVRDGVVGEYAGGATQNNFGILGTTANTSLQPTTITDAAVMGFSNSSTAYAVAADNEASGGTALRAQANGGGNVTAVSATATTNAGNNAVAGSFTALGGGANETGISISATTGTTTNIGADITATGLGSKGVNVHAASNTGVYVDASNSATQMGTYVTGVRNIGNNVDFTNGIGSGSVWGYNANMNGLGGGAVYSGYHVQNLNTNGTNGILIDGMTAGNGISIGNLVGGVGINVGMASSAGLGISVDASAGGGAVAIKAVGNGTGEPGTSTALQIDNGQVKATGANPFSGRVAYVGGTGTITIANGLVNVGSSIMVSFESGTANGVSYVASVQGVASGSFQVNCSSPVGGWIDYIIINH